MPLITEAKYQFGLKTLESISPGSILSMLRDIRVEIGKLQPSFTGTSLAEALRVAEVGTYTINNDIPVRIDLSEAKSAISAYRRYSEGGCKSCTHLGRVTLCAEDAETGSYCSVSDPDVTIKSWGEVKVKYSGFSPKISKHYETPCEAWKPRFEKTLEKLLEENKDM